MSRLLVVQSKRLLLASAQRSLADDATPARQARVTALRDDIKKANGLYRRSVLDWGSPQGGQFWLMVYSNLIEHVEELTQRLRKASSELPDIDRTDMLADVANLDRVLERWRASMTAAMTEDAA